MGKKDRGFNTKLILPIFVVFILVTSMFGFMWSGSNTKVEYRGFKLIRLDTGAFLLRLGDSRVAFNYFPSALEWINSSAGIKDLFSTPMVYLTSDPNSAYAEPIAQMQFNLAQLLDEINGVYAQNSFTSETEFNVPVITCENATQAVPVILFENSSSTQVMLDNSCIRVGGKNKQEMFMAYERLLYIIFGVME